MRRLSLVIVIGLLLPAAVFAQAPAAGAPGAGRVAVVDFQKAVTENSEGKKAQERFMAELNRRQKEFEDKQKTMTDAQTKLQTGDKALSDTAKADLAKTVDKLNTELQRMNDDAQKDLGDLQQQLFRPIAEKTQDVLKTYSNENGFAVVFDISQGNSILYWQDVADITTEIIRRVDSSPAKPTAAPPAAAPKAPEPPKK
jgi:Skp family chaperone for outer membrane proteins